MRNILFTSSTVFILSCCLLSCSKELEESNNVIITPQDTSAQFAVDTSDLCSAVSSNGDYIMGSALTENEFLQLKVNVTKTGKYFYSTDTLNGYYFSDSGNIDDIGAKTLVLKGHGTPLTAGNSRFTFNGGTVAQTIAVLDTHVVVEAVPPGFYMTGKFGDMDFNVVPVVDVNSVSYGYDQGSDSTAYASFIYPEWPHPSGTGALSIQKQFFYPVSTLTEEDFKPFFAPGAYPVAYRDCEARGFSEGVWVGWVDDEEVGWYMKTGADQEGSSFKIVGVEDGRRDDGKYFVKVKAKLTCKVYKETTNEMKQLKDVEFVSYFIKGR